MLKVIEVAKDIGQNQAFVHSLLFSETFETEQALQAPLPLCPSRLSSIHVTAAEKLVLVCIKDLRPSISIHLRSLFSSTLPFVSLYSGLWELNKDSNVTMTF